MIEMKLSVHQLVDFLLRCGDIDNRIYNKTTMAAGSKIHAYYQKKQNNEYLSEYPLQETFNVGEFAITLQGRADGIIVSDKNVTIDEIKSTVTDLEGFYESQHEWHLGQAKCYALMFAHEKQLTHINVRLTYISQITDTQIQKNFSYTTEQLEEDIDALFKEYLNFYQIIYRHHVDRNKSCSTLSFPFENFRKGQRELSKYVYSIAKKGGTLFVEAPTGIGKTMSTLYPYVRSFEDGYNEKIFYLTAKGSGREAAFNATELLKDKGLKTNEIIITSKDKICLNSGSACNPDECPYARGYYNKVQGVITEMLLKEDKFDYDTIIKYASNNDLCPFEMELDLSLFVDIIICDYNYLFDPLVYMRRYFDEDASHFIVLIDEAHNLVDRGRDMFSSSLDFEDFKQVKKDLKNLDNKKMQTALRKMTKCMNGYLDEYNEENPYIEHEYIEDKTILALNDFFKCCQDVMKNDTDFVTDDFLNFFFAVNKLLKIYELFDSSFRIYVHFKGKKKFDLNLSCIDPSEHLYRAMSKVKSRVLFSATLSPIDYFVRLLGGRPEDSILTLDSPFAKENLLVIVNPTISTKYSRRDESYDEIVKAIKNCCRNKVGNYFVFFPSYQYLDNVLQRFNVEDERIYAQTKDMKEQDKIDFLNLFQSNPDKTTIGFVVLGGVFGEGIDLIDDRLIGAIIIGVGLPQICYERNMIKQYHDLKGEKGFEYAYVNNGINRVMQAIGRVIRSEQDRGVILLIDDRYTHWNYKKIFKGQLANYHIVSSGDDIEYLTKKFWDEK